MGVIDSDMFDFFLQFSFIDHAISEDSDSEHTLYKLHFKNPYDERSR